MIYKRLLILFLFLSIIFIAACEKKSTSPKADYGKAIKMAIITDLHYYDPELGTSGDDFEYYVNSGRKLIAESHALMEAVVEAIKAENIDIVLVPGDLTKDGAQQCHEKVAYFMDQIEASGKKVYVVPGNHDIENPSAFGYPEDVKVTVPNITKDQFREIYNNFGYNEAIYKDASTLSYIVQPRDSIWILGLDACNYNNKFDSWGIGRTGGAISYETMTWIEEKMAIAKEKNITVFAFLHHGVVEHFPNMDMLFGDYLLYQWQDKAEQLASLGINVVFTGHHHATDISRFQANGSYIIDIQTGSLVSWQCPYRIVDYNGRTNMLSVDNKVITQINYDTGTKPFQTYAYDFLNEGMSLIVIEQLMGMRLSEKEAKILEPIITPTLMAYYHGDEPDLQSTLVMSEINTFINTYHGQMSQLLGAVLLNIWNDDTPDNDVLIDLNTGSISKN